MKIDLLIKIHVFWEGHKIVVPVKSKVEIFQNFVAFLDHMNFTWEIECIADFFFSKKLNEHARLLGSSEYV